MRDIRPPVIGRLLVAARPLGARRLEIESDLHELLQIRALSDGIRAARRRYLMDAVSLWTSASFGSTAPARATTFFTSRRGHLMQNFLQDLRYGARMMRKSPGFTAIAVLSLAIGIGANTTLFSVADAVLLRTLPVEQPERLVLFNWQAPRVFRTPGLRGTFVREGYAPGMWGSSTFQHRMLSAFHDKQREAGTPLDHLFAFAALSDITVVNGLDADVAAGQVVSGSYFAGLGVPAAMGRPITQGDDDPAAEPVAVISHKYWQERFAGDPSIVGRTIVVNSVSVAVVGVTPPWFRSPSQIGREPDVSLPLALAPRLEQNSPMVDRPERVGSYWALVMGRLKPGASPQQARDYFGGAFQAIALELMPPPRRPGEPATLEAKDYPQLIMRDGSRGLWEVRTIYSPRIKLLFGVVALVLLIACANVANLLLSRSVQRGPEITLRLAMGAGPWRVVRQLLTESVMLAGAGGVLGVILSIWGTQALAAFSEAGEFLPPGIDYSLSWRVLGFSAAASLATGILFGVVPAWRSARRDLTLALKDTTRSGRSASRSWFTRGLVVTQVAMSLVLLVGAGLFVRTLTNLQRIDTGFNQRNLLVFALRPAAGGYEGARLEQFYNDVSERLDAVPGVRTMTFAQMPLVAHYMYGAAVLLPGESQGTSEEHPASFLSVRENFFEAMEIPVIRGRGFTARDTSRVQRVVVINETLANKYFPGKDPIGQRVGYDEETKDSIEIVGITRDIIYNSQREEKGALMYLPWRQEDPAEEMYFSLRASAAPRSLVSAAREAVRAVDNSIPLVEISTQEDISAETLAEERQYATLIGIAGALALGLAALGLYGVIAYWVTQRTSEIGLRMALGAQQSGVLRMVLRQAMVLVLIGLIAGSATAFWLARFIANRLYGVEPNDPLTLAVVGALLVAMALAACIVPARRAARLDPMIAFRAD